MKNILESESYQRLRNEIMREINSNVIKKKSFEIYKKTKEEKEELREAKKKCK